MQFQLKQILGMLFAKYLKQLFFKLFKMQVAKRQRERNSK